MNKFLVEISDEDLKKLRWEVGGLCYGLEPNATIIRKALEKAVEGHKIHVRITEFRR